MTASIAVHTLCLIAVGVSATEEAAGSVPNAHDLLASIREVQGDSAPVAMTLDIYQNYSHESAVRFRAEYRRDGERIDVDTGTLLVGEDGKESDLVDSRYIFNGDRAWIRKQVVGRKFQGFVRDDKSDAGFLAWRTRAPYLIGVLDYGTEHYAALLQASENARVRPEMELVDGYSCYVLEGDTMNGRYTVWVDPANEVLYRKAVIEKVHAEPVDVGGGVFLESEITEIGGVVIERFQDIPAITHIRKTVRKTLSDGSTSVDVHEASVAEVRWNPDFEAMGAFVMDWPEGALVQDMDYGLTYVAVNGQLTTPVDPLAVEEIERLVVAEGGASEDVTSAVRDAGTERASGQVSASRPVAATPHSARNWSPLVYALAGVTLAVCVVCAAVYRRRRMGA